jgi:hypothetical protein
MLSTGDTGTMISYKFEELKSKRYIWNSMWNDIRQLVRINVNDFSSTMTNNRGEVRTTKIYDGTPVWAMKQLAAGLQSFVTNPIERWFSLAMSDNGPLSADELSWLEIVSDIIYNEYSRPICAMHSSSHEMYLDLSSFGTGVIYQDWSNKAGGIVFRSFALPSCYIDESADGYVDTLFRTIPWTRRQIAQEFGEDNLPPKIKEKPVDKSTEFNAIHAVFPRDDADMNDFLNTKMPYASIWYVEETKEVLRNSGYKTFPYHVARWSKMSGEIYGRGAAVDALPDIKMLNAMAKTIIKAAQKMVDPPLMVPDEGYILPLSTAPGSLMFYTPGSENIVPLEFRGNIPVGLDMLAQKQDQIAKAFHVDWLLRMKKKERQTAAEVYDDRNEMLRQMAPELGRLQAEFAGPMLARTFSILLDHGKIPFGPMSVLQRGLGIEYRSQLARAQEATKADDINKFMQDIIPVANIDRSMLDRIDPDRYVDEMAKIRGISRKVLRSDDEVKGIRDARKQQEDSAMQSQITAESAAATKDIASAQKMRSETI